MSAPRRRTQRRADLSQHFLRKGATAARVVQFTTISNNDLVVEIGAGRGALTKPLCQRAGKVIAVELDKFLANKLEAEFGLGVDIVNADILKVALPTDSYKVLGNVPYNITTDIIRRLIEVDNPPLDIWVIVQREAAQRFCGAPYTRENIWSLKLKPRWHVEIVDRLSRFEFDPPPAVESALLWLSRRERPLLSVDGEQCFQAVVQSAYQHDNLKRAMKLWLSRKQFQRLAIDLHFSQEAKPSMLCFEQWLGIVRFIERNHY
ncbi:MAG: rRNA adenine dimethyltransferase family protein [Pseudomonadota bacterium]